MEASEMVRIFPAELRPNYGQVRVFAAGAAFEIRYGPDYSGRYSLVDPGTGEVFAAVFTDGARSPLADYAAVTQEWSRSLSRKRI